MPRPLNTTFNTTGFTYRQPAHVDGFSLLRTSPFRSDGEAWVGGATQIEPDVTHPHMGWVTSERITRKGKHKPGRRHLVRIACEHMALEAKDDCKFRCEQNAQTGAWKP